MEIKFRGYHPVLKEMFFFDMWIPWEAESKNGDTYYTKNMLIDQFTGLTDKNGVDIYRRDVMSPIHYQKVEFGNAVVEFKKGMFCFEINKPFISTLKPLTQSFGYGARANNHFIVIGNIHQNPELLEGKQ